MDEQDENQTRVIDVQFKEELLHRLNELRKANFKCDTTVQVEGQDFPAHSHVLSAASDYFKALFSSELQVKEKQDSLVELNDMKSSTISEVMEFIYSGEANISSSNAHDVVIASDYLIIPSLKSKAAQFLEQSMNASNCLALESFASQYNCDLLKQAAIKYKYKHFVPVVKSIDFLSLGFEKIKELMCEDELNITEEEEVYEAAMAWIKHDLSSRECFLPDLLKCLRLFSMSKYSLRNILNKEELIMKNLICTIILNNGLDFFLFPDRFLGRLLKHRTSIENEEHVVVLIGGYKDDDFYVSLDACCFVLATKKWQSLGTIPESCFSYPDPGTDCVSAVCGGRVYVIHVGDDDNSVSCFNPPKNTWKSKETEFLSAIDLHEAFTVTSFNEELYVIGGIETTSDEAAHDVHKYNPSCDTWKQLASMESGRAGHCAVVLQDIIYVIAGVNNEVCLKSVESYEPSTNQWRKVPDLANVRRFAAAATACGKIVVVGGFCNMGPFSESSVEPTCEVFDPCVNQWSLVSSPNVPRAACGIVSVDDAVYVFGGHDGDSVLDSVECFDAKCNEWHEEDATMPEAKSFVQASLLKLPKKFLSSSTR